MNPVNLIIAVIVVALLYALITREDTPRTETIAEPPKFNLEFPYADKTLLFYDPSHGNQIEYFAPNGKCYLWYPGNKVAVPGHWRIEGENICFLFGQNTYNPVTDTAGGHWEKRPFIQFAVTIVHCADGDVHGLATGRVPYSLPAHPAFESVEAAKVERVKVRRDNANCPCGSGKAFSQCHGAEGSWAA